MALCGVLLAIAMAGCEPRYGALQQEWSFATGDTIAATPAVNWSRVFMGSWDGYEYALDETTGAQLWRTFLGQAPDPGGCDTLGVTSSPLLLNGTLHLGRGIGYWSALNMYTGNILWSVPTGSISTGHYNWSSPVELNGHAFVGIASLCDTPLVQGKLLRVDLASHQIVNTWKVVPDGQVGGTIWTKPIVDAARNTVFVTTGNRQGGAVGDTQQHGEAMVALDATTLAVKGFWSLPLNEPTPDADWGTGPTLFRDSLGRDLVSAANKNGILYAFLRDNVSAGPVWTRRVAAAAAGSDPGAGGVYSNGLFDGQRLYYAGGGTTIGGNTVEGSVRALDPRTGAIIWEKPLPTRIFGALTGGNGMLVVPAYRGLYVLDPGTGEILYQNPLTLYAAATVAHGRLFVGDFGGVVHAYTYPASPGAGATAATAQVALARGCQETQQLASSQAAGSELRVTRIGNADAGPATVAVFQGDDCSGPPLASETLSGGESAAVTVPRSLRAGGSLSVRSSQAIRLTLGLARR